MIAMYLQGLEPALPYALGVLLSAAVAAAAAGSARRGMLLSIGLLVLAAGAFVGLHRGPLDPERQFPLRQRDLALIERELAYRDHITDYTVTLLEQNHQLDVAELRQHYEPELESWRRRYAEATQDLGPVAPGGGGGAAPAPGSVPVTPPAAATPVAPAPPAATGGTSR